MKPTLIALLALGLCLPLGCGKKATSDETANELFVNGLPQCLDSKVEANGGITPELCHKGATREAIPEAAFPPPFSGVINRAQLGWEFAVIFGLRKANQRILDSFTFASRAGCRLTSLFTLFIFMVILICWRGNSPFIWHNRAKIRPLSRFSDWRNECGSSRLVSVRRCVLRKVKLYQNYDFASALRTKAFQETLKNRTAGVVELVDTGDLKSPGR